MSNKRSQKWIQPQQQLGMVAVILATALCAVVVQGVLTTIWMTGFAMSLPNDAQLANEALPGMLFRSSLVTLATLVPLLLFIGRRVSFRVFGPVHHMKEFLRSVQRGEQETPCRLRKHDQFGDLCELINEVTEPLRGASEPTARDGQESDEEQAA